MIYELNKLNLINKQVKFKLFTEVLNKQFAFFCVFCVFSRFFFLSQSKHT